MMFTVYPKRLLVTAVFLVVFGATLAVAADVERGLATAGVLAVLAYLFVELFVTFNPAGWWRERRNGRP
jgi:hypothetical protein